MKSVEKSLANLSIRSSPKSVRSPQKSTRSPQKSVPITYEDLFTSKSSLLDNETRGVLGTKILSKNISTNNRRKLVDWLVQIYGPLGLKLESFFASVNILDAYLARSDTVDKVNLQLCGLSALSLAGKYHEIVAPKPSDYVSMSNNTYTEDQLYSMEQDIFKMLGCNINVPEEMDYLRVVSSVSEASFESHNMAKNLLVTISIAGTVYLTSVVVTAVRSIISKMYDEEYVDYFDIPDNVVESCVDKIIMSCRLIKRSANKAYIKLPLKDEWIQLFNSICKMTPSKEPNVNEYTKAYHFKANISIALLNPSVIPKGSRKLGEGTFGVVKRVAYNGQLYAVKKTKLNDNDILTSAFLREVSIMLSLDHDNISKVRYITSDLRSIFLDLGDGDMKWFIDQIANVKRDIQISCSVQLLSALSYMHSMGCLHRDIKPQNIIVYIKNNQLSFVLSDFGGSRGPQIALKDNKFTHEVCTLWYRSPEILLGSSTYNAGLDVWSMMCTLYQFATRTPLFPGDSEIDQLFKIFRKMGTPNDTTWPGVSSLSEYKTTFPNWKEDQNLFKNVFLSDCYVNLLTHGLIMDPSKRPSSKELLEIANKYV